MDSEILGSRLRGQYHRGGVLNDDKLTSARLNLLHAEQRAEISERHAAELADSLQHIELMLPLLLQSEEIEKINTLDINDTSRQDFVETLGNLLHRFKYQDTSGERNEISSEEWCKLNNEEMQLQISVDNNILNDDHINLLTDEQYSSKDSLLTNHLNLVDDSHSGINNLTMLNDNVNFNYIKDQNINNDGNNKSKESIEYININEVKSSHKFSWKRRYYALRESAVLLSKDLQSCRNDLHLAKTAMQELCNSVVTQGIISENYALRAQTVILRNEILSLKNQISDIQVSAVQAIEAMDIENYQEMNDSNHLPNHKLESISNEYNMNDNDNKKLDNDIDSYDSEGEEAFTKNNLYDINSAGPDDPLEIALSAIQIPIIEERFMKGLFLKYATNATTEKKNICINSFKFFRLLKDFGITDSTRPPNEANYLFSRTLSYGDANIVYQESVKLETDDKITRMKTNCLVRSKSLKGNNGTDEWKPNSTVGLSRLQFQNAIANIALRLYSDLIEIEFETEIFLLKGTNKTMALNKAFEMLLQDKLIPIAIQQQGKYIYISLNYISNFNIYYCFILIDILPWSLIHLERTIFALQQLPIAFQILVKNRELVISWFTKYATKIEKFVDDKSLVMDINMKSKHSLNYMKAVTSNALQKEEACIDNIITNIDGYIVDPSVAGWTYKACSKFAHDFGIVPYIQKEAQLFG